MDMNLIDLVKSTYTPPRKAVNSGLSIKNINSALRPYGFRINYWGYCKYYLQLVYQFVPLKESFEAPNRDLVIVYHHGDMLPEDWVFTLLERLGENDSAARSQASSRAWAVKQKAGKRIRRKIGRKKKAGRKKIIDNRHIRLDKPKE